MSKEFFQNYLGRYQDQIGQIDAPQTKPFIDIKTGVKKEMDSREGSLLAQTPESGIALDPNKHYVFEAPDGTGIQQMKGSDPNAYNLLKDGWEIQNDTFFDEMDTVKDQLDPNEPNTPFIHTFLRSAADSALLSSPTIAAAVGKQNPTAQKWLAARHGDIDNIGAELLGGVAGAIIPAVLTRGKSLKASVPKILGKAGIRTGLLKVIGQSKPGRLLLAGAKTKAGGAIAKTILPILGFASLGALEAELQEAYDPETNTFDLNTSRFASYMAFGAGIGLGAQAGFKAVGKSKNTVQTINKTLQRNPSLVEDISTAKSGRFRQGLEDFVLNISSKEGRKDMAYKLKSNSFFKKQIFGKTGKNLDEASDDVVLDMFINWANENKIFGKNAAPIEEIRKGLFRIEAEKETIFKTLEKQGVKIKSSELLSFLRDEVGTAPIQKAEEGIQTALKTLKKQNIDGGLDREIATLEKEYKDLIENFIGAQEGGKALIDFFKRAASSGEIVTKNIPQAQKEALNTQAVKQSAILKNLSGEEAGGEPIKILAPYRIGADLEKFSKGKKALSQKISAEESALKGRVKTAKARKDMFDASKEGRGFINQINLVTRKIKTAKAEVKKKKTPQTKKKYQAKVKELEKQKEAAKSKYAKAQTKFSNKYYNETNKISDRVKGLKEDFKTGQPPVRVAEIEDVEIPIGQFHTLLKDYIKKNVPKDIQSHEMQRNIYNITNATIKLMRKKAKGIPVGAKSADLSPEEVVKIKIKGVDYKGVPKLKELRPGSYDEISDRENFFRILSEIVDGDNSFSKRMPNVPNEYWSAGMARHLPLFPKGSLSIPASLATVVGLKSITKKENVAKLLYNKSVLKPQKLNDQTEKLMKHRVNMKFGTGKIFKKNLGPLWESPFVAPRFYYHLGEAVKRATDPIEAYTEFANNLYDSVNVRGEETFETLQESNKYNNNMQIFGEELSNNLTAAAAAVSQGMAKKLLDRMPKLIVDEETGKTYPPDPRQLERFSNELLLMQDPSLVYEKIQRGTLLPSDVGFIKSVMPDFYEAVVEKLQKYLMKNKNIDRSLESNINMFLKSRVVSGTTLSGGIKSLTTGVLEEADAFNNKGQGPSYKLPKGEIPGEIRSRSSVDNRSLG